jgi:2-(1,2-epoxy-1,2-dihydrophenyl)acetyl-CoA isomerase
MTEHILVDRQGPAGIIRLNRPEVLNAWSATMRSELWEQIEEWNDDPSIAAIILTGEGRAFCAGADMNRFARRADQNASTEPETIAVPHGESLPKFFKRSKPLIAAVNGYSVGIGLTFILPCDVRIASTAALFSIRFVRVGLIPELGSTRLLTQLVGLGNATDMCITGRMVPAEEALRMGLVTAVVEPDQLMDAALAKADEIAKNPPQAVAMIKRLLDQNSLDADLDAVMERESIRDQIARRLPEHQEAVAAFREKRAPSYWDQPGG